MRTALPFGYLLIAIVLGVVFIAGAWLAIRGWSRQKHAACVVGVSMVLGSLGLVVAQIIFDESMEWNPVIYEDSRIVGRWKDKRETVTLRADHTVDYTSDTEGFSGKWMRDDWNLRLVAKDVDVMMRFISFRGELRLLTNPSGDPDMWDGDLGLERR